MRFLHTADWHIGKTLKGISRLAEQDEVLREIVAVARRERPDAVLIAGDLYDNAAPRPDAQKLLVRALLALADTGAQVIAIAGNHDNPATLDAYRPLADAAGITLIGTVRTAQQGGVIRFTARSTGEPVIVATLPFLSQRYAVKAAELVTGTLADNAGHYDRMVRDVLANLTAEFRDDAVNLVMAHLTVVNGVFGGGERMAQSIFQYAVPATAFPEHAHYVALGHLHRRQQLPAPCPVHYSGAPFAVDFGEQDNTPVVCLVDAAPGTPAKVTDVPISAGRRMRTLRGTLAELAGWADEVGEDYLRVFVREPARAGLTDEVRVLLPNTIDVRIDPEFAAPVAGSRPRATPGVERSPAELFAEYCAAQGVRDSRVEALFAKLDDEVSG